MTTTTELTGQVTTTDELILDIKELAAMLIFKLAGNHNETLVSDEA